LSQSIFQSPRRGLEIVVLVLPPLILTAGRYSEGVGEFVSLSASQRLSSQTWASLGISGREVSAWKDLRRVWRREVGEQGQCTSSDCAPPLVSAGAHRCSHPMDSQHLLRAEPPRDPIWTCVIATFCLATISKPSSGPNGDASWQSSPSRANHRTYSTTQTSALLCSQLDPFVEKAHSLVVCICR
jgi:hypothetical protein